MQQLDADLSLLALSRQNSGDRLEAILEFNEEPMGPVKLLQLFAAIGVLPKRFDLRTGDWLGSVVELDVEDSPKSRRVLAKAENMPTCMRLNVLPRPTSETSALPVLSLVGA